MKKFSYLEFLKRFIRKARPFQSHIPKETEDALIINKLPGYFLIAALIGVLYYFIGIIRPFIAVIFFAAVLTIAFYPIYKWFLKIFGGMKRLSALVSCLLVILVIIVPLVIFMLMLSGEAISTYQLVKLKIESGVFDKYLQWQSGGFFYDLKNSIQPFLDLSKLDLKQSIISGAQTVSTFIFDQTTTLLAGVSALFLNFILMLFAMYYFFKDGPELVKKIGMWSPLPTIYEGELFGKLNDMVKAIVLGVFFTAIIQGILGGIGFSIIGISNPVFWSALIAIFSFVPLVGTAIIWVPTAIILFILGNYGSGIFILLWGFVLVGTVDNFLRPYLIGGKAKTYPLVTFFVILGGVVTMGLKGIIIGPLVLMALLSLLHIYEAEYSKVLKQ